jgi:GT2 family glycosyltransferase
MTASRIGAVLVNYNSAAFLRRCLEALVGESLERIVVWDNHSSSTDVAALRALGDEIPGLSIEYSKENIGFGPAVNRAVAVLRELAEVDFIWVLNPDAAVRPGAASALAASAKRHHCGVVSPLILSAGKTEEVVWYSGGTIDGRAGISKHHRIGEPRSAADTGFDRVTFVTGTAALYSVEAWSTLGGFREDLFLYCEDADLSIRAASAGIAMGVERAAVVEHWEGGSSDGTTNAALSPTFYYYVQRNRLTVYRPFNSVWGLLLGAGAIEEARLLLLTLRGLDRGTVKRFAASVHGVVDGLRGVTGRRPS